MNYQHARAALAGGVLLLSLPGFGQDIDVMTFTPPEVDQRRNPNYPPGPLSRGEEGAVELQFMVDTEGKPFEIMVTNVTGDEAFGRAATRSIEATTYIPAMADGQPTVGSSRMVMKFAIANVDGTPITGATQQFIRSYRTFLDDLQMDRTAAEAALEVLAERARNHYENAYLNLARYALAKKYGTTFEQMRFLHAALSFARVKQDETYLPESETRSARRELFSLQATNQYFREALETYELIKAAGDTEAATALAPAYERIQAIEFSEQAYPIRLTLNESGVENLKLLKHDVYIEDVEGKVTEFKARCDQKYVGFAVEPEISYNLPREWGVCSLEILGDAGTTFTLVQH